MHAKKLFKGALLESSCDRFSLKSQFNQILSEFWWTVCVIMNECMQDFFKCLKLDFKWIPSRWWFFIDAGPHSVHATLVCLSIFCVCWLWHFAVVSTQPMAITEFKRKQKFVQQQNFVVYLLIHYTIRYHWCIRHHWAMFNSFNVLHYIRMI